MTVTDESGELDVLKAVAARLAGAFPDTSVERVDSSVQHAYHRFDGSRVRTFVPLLVEHAVRDGLCSGSSTNPSERPRPRRRPYAV